VSSGIHIRSDCIWVNMRLAGLLVLACALLCEDCLRPPAPRVTGATADIMDSLLRVLSLPSNGLSLLEVKVAAQELAQGLVSEQDLLRLVSSGKVAKYLKEWPSAARQKLAEDYGDMAFRTDLQGLFSPATSSLLYTHPSNLASPSASPEDPAVAETYEEDHCPQPFNFRYQFPRAT